MVAAGTLRKPDGRRNPGAFDFGSYLRNRRIHRTLTRCTEVRAERRPGTGRAGEWVNDAIARRVPGPPGPS